MKLTLIGLICTIIGLLFGTVLGCIFKCTPLLIAGAVVCIIGAVFCLLGLIAVVWKGY